MPRVFKDHFSQVAGSYAAFRPDYPRDLFSWLASLVPSPNCAWDCATGNGQAAVHLAEFFDGVIATDASGEQIAKATLHPKIQYRVATAEESGLEAASVDLVTVAQAAHWFNLPKFYSEVRRVVRPGGLVALWCYGSIQFADQRLQRLVDHFYEHVVGPYWPPERALIEQQYRTLVFTFDPVETAPGHFSMNASFTLDRLLGYLRTWSATQRFIRANGFDPVDELGEALGQVWGSAESVPQSNWPIYLRIGRVS